MATTDVTSGIATADAAAARPLAVARRVWLRTLVAAGAGSAATAAAAACGPFRRGPPAPATIQPTTLMFTHWWAPPAGWGVAMDQALAGWAARGTPVKVESQFVASGDFFTKIAGLLAAGTPPDVTFIQPFNFTPLYIKGAWAPIDALAKRDDREVRVADFYPEPLARVTKEGKLFGLPTDINVTHPIYNKSLFAASGVRPPTDDWMWDSLLDTAKQLATGEGGERRWGTHFPAEWEVVVWANGGEVLNKEETRCRLDEPAAYEAIQWLADWRHRHRVAPLPADLAQQNAETMFVSGRAAMWPTGTGALGNIRLRAPSFDWALSLPPKGKAGRKGYLRGANIALLAGSRQRESGWLFLKYMSSPSVHTLWANPGGLMPPRKSVADSGVFLQTPPLDIRKAVEAAPFARNPHFIPEYVEMTDIINRELALVWNTGQKTAREATQEIKRQVDTLLAQRPPSLRWQ